MRFFLLPKYHKNSCIMKFADEDIFLFEATMYQHCSIYQSLFSMVCVTNASKFHKCRYRFICLWIIPMLFNCYTKRRKKYIQYTSIYIYAIYVQIIHTTVILQVYIKIVKVTKTLWKTGQHKQDNVYRLHHDYTFYKMHLDYNALRLYICQRKLRCTELKCWPGILRCNKRIRIFKIRNFSRANACIFVYICIQT